MQTPLASPQHPMCELNIKMQAMIRSPTSTKNKVNTYEQLPNGSGRCPIGYRVYYITSPHGDVQFADGYGHSASEAKSNAARNALDSLEHIAATASAASAAAAEADPVYYNTPTHKFTPTAIVPPRETIRWPEVPSFVPHSCYDDSSYFQYESPFGVVQAPTEQIQYFASAHSKPQHRAQQDATDRVLHLPLAEPECVYTHAPTSARPGAVFEELQHIHETAVDASSNRDDKTWSGPYYIVERPRRGVNQFTVRVTFLRFRPRHNDVIRCDAVGRSTSQAEATFIAADAAVNKCKSSL